jgi:cell division protein FtsI (penicillin-binding protein 3)
VNYSKSNRYWFVIGFLCLASVGLIARYAFLAAGKDSSQPLRDARIERGRILDRNGTVLAVDSPLYNISVWKPETDKEDFPKEVDRLSAVLGVPSEEILAKWSSGNADFFYIKKRVPPSVARAVQDIKSSGALGGVTVEQIPGRLYPEGRLASHLLGFVGDENHGLAGVENKYDEVLSAPPPGISPGVSTDNRTEVLRGKDVVLTIDANLQFVLEEVGRRAYAENGAEAVMILAEDIKSGEILSYVNFPDFDPNVYAKSSPEAWRDLPVTYAYEPGSVFKVFSLSSILDLGAITSQTTFECNGAYIKIAPSGEKIVIKDLNSYGTLDLEGILAHSSNAGTGYASDRVDSIDLYDRLRSFGFGTRTGIALLGEVPGGLREPMEWSIRSKPTIAMGQEVTVTAVQMVNAASAVGNLGILMKPLAVRSVLNPDGTTAYENKPQPVRRVISEESARTVMSAMESAAAMTGTGWRAKIGDMRMSVKTGTAQMYDPATGTYSDKDYIASTLALFPAEDPRIALYIAVVKPRGVDYLGGRVAAPVVKEATEAVLSILDIPRGNTATIVHPGTVSLPRIQLPEIVSTMPDLTGIPKRLLLPLLQRRDLHIILRGDGYVFRQSPKAGAPLESGSSLILELR